MIVNAIRTQTFSRPEPLHDFLVKNLPKDSGQLEGAVLAVTSKLVSIAENRVLPKLAQEGSLEQREEKLKWVKADCDTYLGESHFGVHLTVKHGILIPTSGIDESNAEAGGYILFPEAPYESAKSIYRFLVEHYRLKNFGVILTDSHTTPLRKGVVGIGLAHFGFRATRNLVGSPDLFGRVMKVTEVNVLDALATAAVYLMGETNDSCPLALIQDSGVEWVPDQTPESAFAEIHIPLEQDLYGKFFLS